MKKLLTIGQVAARLGRSVDFVRQETDNGELQAEPRGKGKYRHYTEAAVAAYEAKQQRHRTPQRAHAQPRQASPPPRPARPARPSVDRALPVEEPFWSEPLDIEPPAPPAPRAPSPVERLYLDTLIAGGILSTSWDLPAEWRGKLQADLQEYVTIERFPMDGSVTSASTTIRQHVNAVLAPYQDAKNKEEEKRRAHEAAVRVAADRRNTLIDYGHKLVEHELATWAPDDPKDQARREIDLVLQAEVKAEFEERAVRELVQEQLDRYQDDDEDEDENEDDEEVDEEQAGEEDRDD